MKKHLFLSVMLMLSFIFVSAQTNIDNNQRASFVKNKIEKARKIIHSLSESQNLFREEVGCFIEVDSNRISEELIPADSSNIKIYDDNGYITVEIEGWVYNKDSSFYEIDGKSIIFGLSTEFTPNNDDDFAVVGDSAHIYEWDNDLHEMVKLGKLINVFENGLVQSSTLSIGTEAEGYIAFLQDFYYYDDNDFLIAHSDYALDFFEFTFYAQDSLVFTNDDSGKPLEEANWHWNVDDTAWNYIYNKTHQYNAQGLLDITTTFVVLDSVVTNQITRKTFEYDDQNRPIFDLLENTDDNGVTYTPSERHSVIFNSNFSFNFPDRIIDESFLNDAWITHETIDYKNCYAMGINEPKTIALNAWLSDNNIYFNTEENTFKNGHINLFNVAGKIVFHHEFSTMPEYITTSYLSNGIYFLTVIDSENRGVIKLVVNN